MSTTNYEPETNNSLMTSNTEQAKKVDSGNSVGNQITIEPTEDDKKVSGDMNEETMQLSQYSTDQKKQPVVSKID